MTGFYPTNQNTLYLLHLFYSDNEIITVHGRPAICTLIGWFKSSCLFISLFGFRGFRVDNSIPEVPVRNSDLEAMSTAGLTVTTQVLFVASCYFSPH